MVGQYCGSEKEEWEVVSVCGFHKSNKACPKDPFPMPRIDQLVDATVGHPQMSFLDAFRSESTRLNSSHDVISRMPSSA